MSLTIRCDPHETYNCNFPEEEWKLYQKHEKTLQLAEKVKSLIDNSMVARINNSLLYDIDFDIKSRVDYHAPTLQVFTSSHWAAMAIAMLIHAKFEVFREEGVTRFSKSPSSNPIMYYPNIEFIEDEWGREHAVWKGTKQKEKEKQLEMFEF